MVNSNARNRVDRSTEQNHRCAGLSSLQWTIPSHTERGCVTAVAVCREKIVLLAALQGQDRQHRLPGCEKIEASTLPEVLCKPRVSDADHVSSTDSFLDTDRSARAANAHIEDGLVGDEGMGIR